MNSPGSRHSGKIIFVTGTDTGVGKTLLTGLLLHYLRQSGVHALAMKPFCSGSRDDAKLLCAIQDGELRIERVNPFYFRRPLAPLAAARTVRKSVPRGEVLARIRDVESRCERLLVEGIGGVLVPLGKNYTVADLISRLSCEAIVVARNQLGTLNHTLLTVEALRRRGIRSIKVVVMGQQKPDSSASSNALIMQDFLSAIPVFRLEFLGANCMGLEGLKIVQKKNKKTLARILT
jgi:dethiobiotin synthetase